MFCARCGTQVGAHDAVCPQCGLNLRLPGAVRMTDPGSCDETRVQSPVSEGATPTREIPRVQTPSEPVEWQDSMPTQQWQVQDSTPTQQWTTNAVGARGVAGFHADPAVAGPGLDANSAMDHQ